MGRLYFAAVGIFLSTPSARRATAIVRSCASFLPYFYPRPPRGGRRGIGFLFTKFKHISIHALREEGDSNCQTVEGSYDKFLSTPSARRATC